jgi:hypothetical protein
MRLAELLLVMLFVYSTHTAPPVVTRPNHILFEHLGRFAPVAGYMHIRIPVPLKPFLQFIDQNIKEFKTNKEQIKQSQLFSVNNKLFDHGITRLEQTKTDTLHYLQNLPKPTESNKRQIVGWVALGMATTAMATASYNTIEIEHLNANFKTMQNKHNMLVDITQLHDNHLHTLDIKVKNITGYWMDYFFHNPTLIATRIQEVTTEAHRLYYKFTHAFTQAINQKLPTDFLSPYVTDTILAYIKKHVFLKNFMAPVNTVADLFHLDASYLYDNGNQEFIIFLHVPVTRNTELMELHKFHAFPLAGRTADNMDIIPMVGNENVIAVGKNNQYIPMTEAELIHCPIIQKVYLCKGKNVIQHDYTTTCIGAMYNQENEHIKELCDFKITKPQEMVKQLDHDQWLVTSPTDFTTRLECDKNFPNENLKTDSIRITKDKTTTVTIPVGCKLKLQKQTIQGPEMDLGQRKGITKYEWTFDEDIMDLNIPEVQLNKTISGLMDIVNNTPAPMDLSNIKIHDSDLFHSYSSWMALAALAISSCIVIGALYYMYRKKCSPSTSTSVAPNAPTTLAIYNAPPAHLASAADRIRLNFPASTPAKDVY